MLFGRMRRRLFLLMVLALAGGGYYMYQQNQNKPTHARYTTKAAGETQPARTMKTEQAPKEPE